jgi:hypothetical protein
MQQESRLTQHKASTLVGLVTLTFGRILLAQEIENAEVYSSAIEVADEVELIREVMGRPYDDTPRLPVSGITLFELWFHAETLAIKANRLAQELADAAGAPRPAPPGGPIQSADIDQLVDRALTDVRQVRSALGIREEVTRELRDSPISPTGVFSIILDTNRQLDLLLENSITPADVLGRVNAAASYATGVLALSAAATDLPEAYSEGPRTPLEVYVQLLECADLVKAIATKTGADVATLSSRRNLPASLEPGHIYDLAQIVLADIVMVAIRLGAEPVRFEFEQPRHVFPSHVYERVGVLQRQLARVDDAL